MSIRILGPISCRHLIVASRMIYHSLHTPDIPTVVSITSAAGTQRLTTDTGPLTSLKKPRTHSASPTAPQTASRTTPPLKTSLTKPLAKRTCLHPLRPELMATSTSTTTTTTRAPTSGLDAPWRRSCAAAQGLTPPRVRQRSGRQRNIRQGSSERHSREQRQPPHAQHDHRPVAGVQDTTGGAMVEGGDWDRQEGVQRGERAKGA